MKPYIFVALLVATNLLAGCEDTLPTASGPDLIPGSPRSVEIFFDFDDVVDNVQVYSGFGSVASLDTELLAKDVEGVFNARVLSRFRDFPEVIQAVDAEGTTLTDSMFTVIGGRVTVQVDTTSIDQDTATFVAGAVTTPWHPRTASWEFASDTAGGTTAWPEPGGGPVEVLDTAVWRSVAGEDSVHFDVDSATVASWMEEDPSRGVRIEIDDAGIRLETTRMNFLLRVQPSIDGTEPQFVETGSSATTFIYDPAPDPPTDGLRFGGAPAWRSVFRIDLPDTLTGPAEVCDLVECPLDLSSDQVTYAGLQLVSRETSSLYSSNDSLVMEIRTVLSPERLPRSPLGSRPVGGIGGLSPDVFGLGAGELVEVPMTDYLRDLIGDGSDEGTVPPNTVALLSPAEPLSFAFGEFHGGNTGAFAPRFRLILTLADEVDLP